MYRRVLVSLISIFFISCQEEKNINIENNRGTGIVQHDDTLAVICGVVRDSIDNVLDSSLQSTLNRLSRAIEYNNFIEVVELLDENVIVSYGEAISGKKDFIEYWKDSTQQVNFWTNFSLAFSLGGAFEVDQNHYTFPYFQSSKYEKRINIDCYDYGIIVNDGVLFYDDEEEETNKVFRGDIVKIIDYSKTMIKVKMNCSEKEGWIKPKQVYLCVNHSIVLVKSANGDWKIKVFSTL